MHINDVAHLALARPLQSATAMSNFSYAFILLVGCADLDPVTVTPTANMGENFVVGANNMAPYSGCATTPELCSAGGTVLAKSQISAVWWAADPRRAHTDAFYQAFVKPGAGYLGLLAEYGIQGATYEGSYDLNSTITRHDCAYTNDGGAHVQCDVVRGATALSTLAQKIADNVLPPNVVNASYYAMHFPDDVWVETDFTAGYIGRQPLSTILDWHSTMDCRATPQGLQQFINGGFEASLGGCAFDPTVAPALPYRLDQCWARSDVNHTQLVADPHKGQKAVRLSGAASITQRVLVPPCGTGHDGAHLDFWVAAHLVGTGPAPTLTVQSQKWVFDETTRTIVPQGFTQLTKIAFDPASVKYQEVSLDATSSGGLWTDFRFIASATGDSYVDIDDVKITNVNALGQIAYGINQQGADAQGEIDAVYSHEAIEAITDPYGAGYSQTSWDSPTGGEIADICDSIGPAQYCMVDPDTHAMFDIAPPWSNMLQGCVVMDQPTTLCPE